MWSELLIAMRRSVVAIAVLGAANPGRAATPDETAAPAASTTAFRCQAAETDGLATADVATAVDMVCRELASISGSTGTYRVSLRPLGSLLVLTVGRPGTAEGRSLVLNGFKEIPIAARRLAEAVVTSRTAAGAPPCTRRAASGCSVSIAAG